VHFTLTSATGQLLDEGDGRIEVAGGAIVVSPQLGQPLRIAPADVVDVGEPAPYVIRLRLREGVVVDLSQMGAMRTQVLAEIGERRVDDTVSTLLLAGVGTPERYPGALDDVDAELRLYDDGLVGIPVSGPPVQVPYSFIEGVVTDAAGYRISVDVGEGASLTVSRLARRTSEFVDLLRRRTTDARGRTAAFLGALMPGLGAIGQRSVAGMLRDGLAARRADLEGVEPTVYASLVAAAAPPERVPCVRALESMGEVWLGFKQRASVQVAAQGTTAWTDHSAGVMTADHGGGGTFAPGLGGMMQAGMADSLLDAGGAGGVMRGLEQGFDGAFGGPGGALLAMSMLGRGGMTGTPTMAGMPGMPGMMGMPTTAGETQAHSPVGHRADVERGTVTPESTDYAALTPAGSESTVMAFLLCVTPSGRILYEVLNEPDHATYVYAAPAERLRVINRALVLIGFRVEAIYSDTSTVGSGYRAAVERLPYLADLRTAFVGRGIHTDGWEQQVRGLAAC
jgi:hypothetical protein